MTVGIVVQPFEEILTEGAGLLLFEETPNMSSGVLPFEGRLDKVQPSEETLIAGDEIHSFVGILMKNSTM